MPEPGVGVPTAGPGIAVETSERPVPAAPKLSVIMPAYRAAGVLSRSLGALLESDIERDAWELIVVVDGDSMGRDDDRTADDPHRR